MTTTGAQQPADQAAELLQNLSLDSQTKGIELPEATKKPSTNQCVSVDSSNATNDQFQPYERSLTPLLQEFLDPAALCYLPNGYPSTAYYYGAGFDGTANGWDEFPRFVSQDGVEMTPGVYGDNGSLMYQHGYEYGPYAPYSPGAPDTTLGHDGQLYAPQHYQYPTQYFQHANPTIDLYSSCPTAPSKVEVATSTPAEQTPLSVETANGDSNVVASGGVLKCNNGSAAVKATNQINSNGSYAKGALTVSLPASGYLDPRFCFDGIRCPIPWLDGVYFPDGQPRQMASTPISHSISNFNSTSSKNQNICPHSNLMGLPHPRPLPGINATPGYINRMHPNKMYGQYGNAFRSAYGLPSTGYDSRINDRGWMSADNKYRPRGRANGCSGYGNENMSGLNELTRGPRAKGLKNQKGQNGVLCATTDEEDKLSVDREQYNHADFCEKYTDAKFFIIKSYSEDDVHKSIKYNVWASTPNGNKKLDAAYQEALQKSGGCPVFLFFSVNASGQFVGVAEMVGPVDFNKNVEYWQQDKWNGCFSVKWHIVKDVPNNLLKHITLENNENKPVTNSRDTQEVKIDQGLHLIKIFKDYSSKTCILDDFGFYENREKVIQEKKTKQQQFIKQVWEGKPTDEKNKGVNGELKSPEKTEVLVDFLQDSAVALQANGERKEPSDNSNIPKTNDVPKSAKSVL